jgi:hypothetical protein
LALVLAAVVLVSQTSSAQAKSHPQVGTKRTPVKDPGCTGGGEGSGGGVNVQILILVIVTTPSGEQQPVEFKGRNYQEVLSRAQNYAAAQKAKGNSVRFQSR